MSILTIREILLDYNVSSSCYNIGFENLTDDMIPFVALMTNGSFVVVTDIQNGIVSYYSPDIGNIQERKDVFCDRFGQLALLLATDDYSLDISFDENEKYIKDEKYNKVTISYLIGLIIVITLFSIFYFQNQIADRVR